MRCKRQARSKSSSRAGSEQLCASPFNCFFFENIAVLVRATYSGERLATQDLRRQIKAPATTFRSTHLDAFQMSQNSQRTISLTGLITYAAARPGMQQLNSGDQSAVVAT
jgi:hypothetical protein